VDVHERVERFKELIKRGYSVRKAQKESKLQPRDYKKFYDQIWSDPDMAPFMPERARKRAERAPPEVVEAEERLRKYGVAEEKTPFEREFEDLERKRKHMLRAAQNILTKYGGIPPRPGQPPAVPTGVATEKEPVDPFEEFEGAFKAFEEKRARVKTMLERMGFKVEDIYMTREEVEKLIEETKRKTEEEALSDRRITAVENIIREAVSQIVATFGPAVQIWMQHALKSRGEGTSRKSSKQAAD